MLLHCLGTAGYHPNEQRHTSCYFLPAEGIILDAGTGMFRVRELIQTTSLDILLSHAHLDHIAGLTFLLDVLYGKGVEKVRIWGEQEKLDAIRTHLFSSLVFPVELDAQWCPIDGQNELTINNCKVTWRTQPHPGASIGYRMQWPGGPTLVYLTDTTGQIDRHADSFNADADLLMHECYFQDDLKAQAEKTGHTYCGRLVQIARSANPKQLLLTHVNPIDPQPSAMLDEVAAGLRDTNIGVSLAEDRMQVCFGT
ncbi:MBL fold metallo-hydrolase [Rhodopirellula sp. MGV]|uniref:MBL fold metallo-hydrolase n=1 Tax=Rhodopirellula sp. MGV TaxID=2023130 RepID=UPI000B97B797|nr:MBL fold metallo-hydrolase [Rhodopirellula sp. MGV]OYP38834.1 ribonuclease Z [Rhodopirellula sp. MGV]PNY37644.1 ribonuclease Z [Rhodopirellula baltica]